MGGHQLQHRLDLRRYWRQDAEAVRRGSVALRASAVWDHNPIIIAILVLGGCFNAAIGFSAIPAAKFVYAPAGTPGTLGNCVPVKWQWELGVAYAWTLTFDFIIIGLICSRLWQMGKRTQSSFTALIFRDGVKFMLLTCVPTAVAVALFYAGRSAPAQSSAMTLAAALHSLLACRAFRNLSNFCERLPVAWRVKVSNGTMLDRDTLARIAFITGGEAAIAEAEEQLTGSPLEGGNANVRERRSAWAWLGEALTGLRSSPTTHQPRRFAPREFGTDSVSMHGVDSKGRGETPMPPIISVVTQQTEFTETMAPWTTTRTNSSDPDATSSIYSHQSTMKGTPKM